MASNPIYEAVLAVSQFLIADTPLGDTLERIAKLAQSSLDGADAVGVTLHDDDNKWVTAISTDRIAPAVDQAQYDDNSGPCLDAFAQEQIIRVDDTRTVADRWTAFSQRAVQEGVLSTLSVPLTAGGQTFGVFNMYSRSLSAFENYDEGDSILFVTQVAVVLANARAYWHMFDLAENLRAALTSRGVIEQAKGVLMATAGCSADAAFDLLRQQSQAENRKLRDVAAELAFRQDRS